jgi:hypothetical protein
MEMAVIFSCSIFVLKQVWEAYLAYKKNLDQEYKKLATEINKNTIAIAELRVSMVELKDRFTELTKKIVGKYDS